MARHVIVPPAYRIEDETLARSVAAGVQPAATALMSEQWSEPAQSIEVVELRERTRSEQLTQAMSGLQ